MPKKMITWVIGAAIAFMVLSMMMNQDSGSKSNQNPRANQSTNIQAAKIDYKKFIDEVVDNNVSYVVFNSNGSITFTMRSGTKRTTYMPNMYGNPYDMDLIPLLEKKGVNYTGTPIRLPSSNSSGDSGAGSLIGMIIMIAIIWVLFKFMQNRQQQGGGGAGNARNAGKSKAKFIEDEQTRFSDVAGCDEAIEEVQEVVEFINNPDDFLRVGANIPRGILLSGPPGTGKTLLAKAIAGEANMAFFSIAGSDFVEMFVGVGASRVRDMFEQAKKHGRAVIFIDEIDAVGKQRGGGPASGGHDEREQTLNQMLVEMDGFDKDDEIIVIAATNRPELLDSALMRPGRFSRQVTVGLPDIGGREKILAVHARNKPMAEDANFKKIASRTPGMSGADLENVLNEAAIFAARDQKNAVDMECIEKAIDKVTMGAERKSMIMTDAQRYETAMHESAHALLGFIRNIQGVHDPVHRVSIMPRGRALGVTMYRPEEDRLGYKKAELLALVDSLHAGRLGELIHHKGNELMISTGASNDLERASDIVRFMIKEVGFSLELGTITAKANQFGQVVASGETLAQVDRVAKKWLDASHKRTLELIEKHKEDLVKMSDLMMDVETIDDEDIENLFGHLRAEYENVPFEVDECLPEDKA